MLPAVHRLRRSTDFAAAIRDGRRAGRGSVVVHLYSPTPVAVSGPPQPEPAPSGGTGSPSPPPRAGFVVSRAVGNAVRRNTVRRRLRHLVRDRIPGLPAGTTLVVRALPAAATSPYDRLAADLDAALAAARGPRRPGRRPR
ncbi:ribonuclease P protein component [Plantactinospora sp. KBS50]|uniref:ribonuclease P protein component n=1 Tax=Plantactinospora sp. KBS50 TaxID=2024580 RepID=UPI000BAB0A16|nr:ribonuclease P protein component [Plantactinospora sp. KBS50]ASW57309.1 ribonuclease P protein component [Plantactinospora sp. KBS50]